MKMQLGKTTHPVRAAVRVRPRLEELESRILLSATFPDFNGDSFDDLAIGVPGEAPGGAVNVIYGSASGLSATGNQLWSQNSAGMRDVAEAGDLFGSALAWGDFDNDGFDDLAIGIPGEDVNGVNAAGAVHVLYGSRSGLISAGNQFWHQDYGSMQNQIGAGDAFGSSLTAGDFNGDGYADLAIGVPGETINGLAGAGAVNVIYGSSTGLSPVATDFWHQNTLLGGAQAGAAFGSCLTSGDYNGDRRDDLAIGTPFDTINNRANAGSVNVIYGSSQGLTPVGNQQWNQGRSGVLDAPEVGDNFGTALTSGDFNRDGRDDLAIGAPGENAGAGAVNVLYGSANRLTGSRSQIWRQGSNGLLDRARAGDRFGTSLAAGDFNGDGFDDLAVGAPLDDISGIVNAGGVNVIYGSASRLVGRGSQYFHQNSAGVQEENGNNDRFATDLTAGDYNGDGRADLSVGVPFEDIGAYTNCGAVVVIYGPFASIVDSQLWWQDSLGIEGAARNGDNFGMALVRR